MNPIDILADLKAIHTKTRERRAQLAAIVDKLGMIEAHLQHAISYAEGGSHGAESGEAGEGANLAER